MKTTTKMGMMLIGFSTFFISCNENDTIIPAGNVTTQDRTLAGYDGIEIGGAITADVSFSNTEEFIEIEADNNLQQYIEVSIKNNVLSIKIKDGISVKGNATLKAHIVTNENVDYYAASGASYIILKDIINVQDLTLNASGASNITGAVSAQSTRINLSGASKMSLSGTTNMLDLFATGASELSDYSFFANLGNFNLTGASVGRLNVNQTIGITASGASSLIYKGDATITSSNLSGASRVVKVD